ncbi:galanin peptides-like isoform X2 [Erpetoichthys calabaricus]|uniref:galanin peptides-like isoform X2 n=1 Tax=Erpetoichthys calabaricus TaxID=27687 RepID=UPI002234045A|nr:galanin peptides-like isoform X2 [Erpetoichthys calabaricus]
MFQRERTFGHPVECSQSRLAFAVQFQDAHRTLNDKGGLAGKRDILDETYKNVREPYAGSNMHPVDESTLQTVLDFLSYLQLKDTGALDSLPVTQEESNLP